MEAYDLKKWTELNDFRNAVLEEAALICENRMLITDGARAMELEGAANRLCAISIRKQKVFGEPKIMKGVKP